MFYDLFYLIKTCIKKKRIRFSVQSVILLRKSDRCIANVWHSRRVNRRNRFNEKQQPEQNKHLPCVISSKPKGKSEFTYAPYMHSILREGIRKENTYAFQCSLRKSYFSCTALLIYDSSPKRQRNVSLVQGETKLWLCICMESILKWVWKMV